MAASFISSTSSLSPRTTFALLLLLCLSLISAHAQSSSSVLSSVPADNSASCLTCWNGGNCSHAWYDQPATVCGKTLSGTATCCPSNPLNGTRYFCTQSTTDSSYSCQLTDPSATLTQQWTTAMTITTVVLLVIMVACCAAGAALLRCCMQAAQPTQPTTIIIGNLPEEDMPPAYEPPSHGNGPLVLSGAHYVRM